MNRNLCVVFISHNNQAFSFRGTRWLSQAQLTSILVYPNAIFSCIATGSSIGRRCEALPSFSFLLFWAGLATATVATVAGSAADRRCRPEQPDGRPGLAGFLGLLPRLGVVVAGRRRQRELGACASGREQRTERTQQSGCGGANKLAVGTLTKEQASRRVSTAGFDMKLVETCRGVKCDVLTKPPSQAYRAAAIPGRRIASAALPWPSAACPGS